MRSVGRSVVVFLVGLAMLAPGPASARTATVSDPAGDGLKGDRLDITAVRVANRDHAIVTTVDVVRVGHGDLGVWIQARGDRRSDAIAVAAFHRIGGDTSRLISFHGPVRCDGLRVTWDESTDRIRARVPSRCLDHGDYGALRVRTITEIHGGEDVDLAPNSAQGDWRWTDWVGRG
jgi:hypothetical protein